MKTETTKELAKKQSTLPSAYALSTEDVGEFDPSDILLAKILLMQGTSQLVAEGKANQGDIVNSLTGQKLGDKTNGITFVPLTYYKTMTVQRFDKTLNKWVFDHVEEWTPKHATMPWETEENGVKYSNQATLNFYVMTTEDLASGIPALPALLSFRSTSYKVGQKLYTLFLQAQQLRRAPCSMLIKLTCGMKKNNKGSFFNFDVARLGDTPSEYEPQIAPWLSVLKTKKVKAHAVEDVENTTDTTLNENSQF